MSFGKKFRKLASVVCSFLMGSSGFSSANPNPHDKGIFGFVGNEGRYKLEFEKRDGDKYNSFLDNLKFLKGLYGDKFSKKGVSVAKKGKNEETLYKFGLEFHYVNSCNSYRVTLYVERCDAFKSYFDGIPAGGRVLDHTMEVADLAILLAGNNFTAESIISQLDKEYSLNGCDFINFVLRVIFGAYGKIETHEFDKEYEAYLLDGKDIERLSNMFFPKNVDNYFVEPIYDIISLSNFRKNRNINAPYMTNVGKYIDYYVRYLYRSYNIDPYFPDDTFKRKGELTISINKGEVYEFKPKQAEQVKLIEQKLEGLSLAGDKLKDKALLSDGNIKGVAGLLIGLGSGYYLSRWSKKSGGEKGTGDMGKGKIKKMDRKLKG